MPRSVPHEVTLLAFEADPEDEDLMSIFDVVETSRRNAYRYTRAWMKNPLICCIAALAPGQEDDPSPEAIRYTR